MIQIGAFIYLLSCFLPLLPSGSFFTDYNITLFFINLSFMYAVNKNTNIFFVEKKNKKVVILIDLWAVSSIVEYCIDIAGVVGA